ncbi:MAG: transporter [Bacteroidota bacterium]
MQKFYLIGCLVFGTLFMLPASSQDLEPRLLSAVPTGGNFAIASYGYSYGNILLDNSLPIEDLSASMNNFVAAYVRSFKLFNKLAKLDVIVPYSFGNFEGVVSNVDSSTSRSGFGDPMFRISMVLVGAGPMATTDFFKQEQKKFNLGAFIRIRPPLGQYDPTKLINLGANRWATKIGLAGSYTFQKKLILEGHLDSWLFTGNKEFWNGNTIKQKPLVSAQMHVAYIIKPGIWAAVSIGQTGRGETIVNGIDKEDLRRGSRYGMAFAYRFTRHSALKIALTSGLSTRYGADFTTAILAYQFIWFDKYN